MSAGDYQEMIDSYYCIECAALEWFDCICEEEDYDLPPQCDHIDTSIDNEGFEYCNNCLCL